MFVKKKQTTSISGARNRNLHQMSTGNDKRMLELKTFHNRRATHVNQTFIVPAEIYNSSMLHVHKINLFPQASFQPKKVPCNKFQKLSSARSMFLQHDLCISTATGCSFLSYVPMSQVFQPSHGKYSFTTNVLFYFCASSFNANGFCRHKHTIVQTFTLYSTTSDF